MKIILRIAFFLSVFMPCTINAQVSSDVQNLSLEGNWEIIFDEKNEGVDEEWYLNKNFGSYPDVREVQVPSCWEEYKKDYEGVAF